MVRRRVVGTTTGGHHLKGHRTRRHRRRGTGTVLTAALVAVTLAAAPGMGTAGAAVPGTHIVVEAGETEVISETTSASSLTIAEGGSLVAPAGYSLTLTVNGVETGGVIEYTGGEETVLAPGTYRGRIVLTVTERVEVPWQGLTFPFRQAIYVGPDGLDEAKSVLAAVTRGRVTDTEARNVRIRSTGENFNGIVVQDADYSIINPRIELEGNGRSDFVGYGAAIVARGGAESTVVVDGARIDNEGVVRTGVVADGGSNVIVKNSRISTSDGELPAGYQSTVDLALMQQAPWMLGIVGTVRATNLLGEGTKASYINSKIYSEGWGVLSTDTGENMVLTSINSDLETGGEGYGSYVIGGATEYFLGTRFEVDTYATINRGGIAYYGDSTPERVAELNAELGLGLTDRELRSLRNRATTVDSEEWGVMWHGAGAVDISGRTSFDTGKTTFLVKNQDANIVVDGSQGADLEADNGILLQVMDDDDPGPVFVNGQLLNAGVYTEPTGVPARTSYDVTTAQGADVDAAFTDVDLEGDFYNAVRGVVPPATPQPGPPPPPEGRNLVLTFTDSSIAGVISASETRHAIPVITAADYQQIGEVTNTAQPAINNGVILTLDGDSTWTVTGTSYLTSLTVGPDASVAGGVMTVDGVPTEIAPGNTYTGAIAVTAG